ncbi:hypothetical protein EDM56_30465 [Brevibacillus fluminis]|uniref:Outer membrane lipoprotein carrier protein LolA n=1 Tax=Brevibacillus fluminis TaxID=511487 RepID=A0A3M8CS79_9BACL|nr:hypothetical protein [Brevibacillus fluminis]RNB78523.1 hypothetical protein EDM56_30465 [Brevibacillus fluminis]
MNMKKILLGSCLLFGVMASGCEENQTVSTDEIVSKTLEARKQIASYAAEGHIRTYEGKNLTDDSVIQEWYDTNGGKRRIELKTNDKVTRTVSDGKQITMYQDGSDTAYTMDVSADIQDGMPSQKDQLKTILEKVKGTHQVDVVGNENMLGFNTIHLKAVPKEKKTLFGESEFWIEEKTWQILKGTMESGNTRTEFLYTKYDSSPVFTDKTFQLDLPKNVKITPLQDANPSKKVTLEQAQTELGLPFLYWDLPKLTLADTELMDLKGEFNRKELTLTYTKNQVPYFSISIFPTPKDASSFPEAQTVKVRGIEGYYEEQIRSLIWDEKGMRYSLLMTHPDLKLEEMLKLAEEMKWTSSK